MKPCQLSIVIWFALLGISLSAGQNNEWLYNAKEHQFASMCMNNNGLAFSCSCPIQGFVNCSKRIIHNIDEGFQLPDKTQKIDLSENEIITVPPGMFPNCLEIKELNLANNLISDIKPKAWPTSLEILDLRHNALTHMSEEVFEGLDQLHTLLLGNNFFTAIEPNWFRPTPDLSKLDLSFSHGLVTLHNDSFTYIHYLKYLTLANCSIENLPVGLLKDNPHITNLSLAHNPMTLIPGEALSGPRASLIHLVLSGTHISVFHNRNFHGFHSLERLELNNMPKLEKIEALAFNSLSSLMHLEIRNNANLTYIDPQAFYDNQVARKPNTPTELYLTNNSLTFLSKTLLTWSELETLDVRGNPWECDCNLIWMATLPEGAIHFQDDVFCGGPASMEDKPIAELGLNEMDCEETSGLATLSMIIVLGGMLILTVAMGIFLYNNVIRLRYPQAPPLKEVYHRGRGFILYRQLGRSPSREPTIVNEELSDQSTGPV